MRNSRLEDHLAGLELQVVELAEREARAELQGDGAQAARLQFVFADRPLGKCPSRAAP
jgi:hypothetical protein